MLGANTDPYQPAERDLRITRSILEVLYEHRHPVGIVTKSSLIERDLDLLARWTNHAWFEYSFRLARWIQTLLDCWNREQPRPGGASR